jgi:hypothetical protein
MDKRSTTMLHKKEFLRNHAEVRMGMTAYDRSGERLGIIENIDDDGVTIEKGRIFHRDVHVLYDDIEDVRADDVIIRQGGEKMVEEREWTEEPKSKASTSEAELKAPPRTREEETRGYGRTEEEEARIPVREEEVEVSKRPVVKDEVRVSKEARTEDQEVSGEVRKENVKVERTAPAEKK